MDFTKRAAIDKGKLCKLLMFCGKEFRYRFIYLLKTQYPDLAYYHFLTLFESSPIAGESGAHVHIIDMEIGGDAITFNPSSPMWPVSVTLNMGLDEYRKMRKEPSFGFRRARLGANKPVPMPRFKDMTEEMRV